MDFYHQTTGKPAVVFRFAKRLVVLGLLLVIAGCAHFPVSAKYQGPKQLPEEIRTSFSYQKFTGGFTEVLLDNRDRYDIRQVEFPSAYNVLPIEHNIVIDYYDLHDDQKTPVVMVLPILGGRNSIAKAFAEYFAENGIAAVVVHRQKRYKGGRSLENLDLTLRQMVFDHRQAIDWIETREDLDASRIGVFGVSMGGIKSALISSLEDRIKASVVALAGGDIPYVLAYSTEKGIIKRRNAIMQSQDLSSEELYELLRQQISCDPLNYAEYLDANKVLMILARFDSVVPYAKGEELKERMGHPETIYLLAGHYTSYLYIQYIKSASLVFFNQKFDQIEEESKAAKKETESDRS